MPFDPFSAFILLGYSPSGAQVGVEGGGCGRGGRQRPRGGKIVGIINIFILD